MGKTSQKHTLDYVTAKSVTSKRGSVKKSTWKDFSERLTSPVSVAMKRSQFDDLGDDEQLGIKQRGGWYLCGERDENHPKRRVITRSAVTIDIDNGVDGIPAAVERLFGQYPYVLYSTFSSRMAADGRPRYRLVLPLAETLALDHYRALATLICQQIGMDHCDVKSSRTAHQLMFFPVELAGEKIEVFKNKGGELLEGFLYLENVWQAVFDGEWNDLSTWPSVKGESAGVRSARLEYAGQLQANPVLKPGLVGDFCRTYTVAMAVDTFLGDAWINEGENRYTYANGSSKKGGIGYAFEAAGVVGPQGENGVFLFSHHESDPYNDRLLNAWDLVRLHKFGHLDANSKAKKDDKLPSWAAMTDMVKNDERVIRQAAETTSTTIRDMFVSLDEEVKEVKEVKEDQGRDDPDQTTPTAATPTPTPTPAPAPDQKNKEDLIKHIRKNNSGAIIHSASNIKMILALMKLPVIFNEFTNSVVIGKDFGFQSKTNKDSIIRVSIEKENLFHGKPLDDGLLRDISIFVEENNLFNTYPSSTTAVFNAIDSLAREHPFNPLKDYFEALPEWDGKERLQGFWVKTAHIKDSTYAREVTENFLIAAVNMVYRPGFSYSMVPILPGVEGAGKSSMVKALLPHRSLFSSSINLRSDKEFMETSLNVWVAELEEVHALHKAEGSMVKRMITGDEMTARMAYDRMPKTIKKSIVMYGTTNETDFLRRDMGTRRFAPLPSNGDVFDASEAQRRANKAFKWIDKKREQLWAEAYSKAKELNFIHPVLSDESVKKQSKMVLEHKKETPEDIDYESAIAYLKDKTDKRVCIKEVFHYADIKNTPWGISAIKRALRDNGWALSKDKQTRRIDYDFNYLDHSQFLKQRAYIHTSFT